MFEIILDNIQLITGVLILLGGTVFGMWKYHKKQIDNAFAKGKQEETCLQRIEGKADDAIKAIEETNKILYKEIEKAAEHHLRIYDKIDNNEKTLGRIAENVSFLKGKFSE